MKWQCGLCGELVAPEEFDAHRAKDWQREVAAVRRRVAR